MNVWRPLNRQIPKDLPSTTPVTATSAPTTIITKPVTPTMSSGQVSSIMPMGQKQIGLLASVGNDKVQEKTTGLTTIVTGSGMVTAAAAAAAAASSSSSSPSASSTGSNTPVIGGHLAEVCAVQGPPRQLTSTSPSPSPTSTTSSSSSPRPSSVNSINFISNMTHQESNGGCVVVPPTKLSQSPATTQICTTPTASYCNTSTGDGQQQSSTSQQRSPASAHITISTTTISNSPSVLTQPSQNNTTNGAIVVAGTVRQLSSVDHQIRVLTPSEIMRTLPSLSQEHYDPPPTAIIHTVPVQNPAMVSHL